MRLAAVAAALCSAGALLAAVTGHAGGSRERTVPCSESIAETKFPYRGSLKPRYRYRVVLDAISAPPAELARGARIRGSAPWTHFSKRGIVIRSGKVATITVPPRWRRRVGIVWGNNGHGVFSSIRIARCGSDGRRGHAYAGGFYLRRPSGCVPLVFGVDGRGRTLWFGIGERCRERPKT